MLIKDAYAYVSCHIMDSICQFVKLGVAEWFRPHWMVVTLGDELLISVKSMCVQNRFNGQDACRKIMPCP